MDIKKSLGVDFIKVSYYANAKLFYLKKLLSFFGLTFKKSTPGLVECIVSFCFRFVKNRRKIELKD